METVTEIWRYINKSDLNWSCTVQETDRRMALQTVKRVSEQSCCFTSKGAGWGGSTPDRDASQVSCFWRVQLGKGPGAEPGYTGEIVYHLKELEAVVREKEVCWADDPEDGWMATCSHRRLSKRCSTCECLHYAQVSIWLAAVANEVYSLPRSASWEWEQVINRTSPFHLWCRM